MKKLFLLLSLGLCIFNTMQPAAAPEDGVPVKKRVNPNLMTLNVNLLDESTVCKLVAGPIDIIKEYAAREPLKDFVLLDTDELYADGQFPYGIRHFSFMPDGNLLTVDTECELAIINSDRLGLIKEIQDRYYSTSSADCSPDGKFIAVKNYSAAQICNAQTGEHVRRLELPVHLSHPVTTLAWSKDSKHIVTGTSSGAAQIWDAQTGKLIRYLQISDEHEKEDAEGYVTHSARFSPDKKYVAACSTINSRDCVVIWDWHNNKIIQKYYLEANKLVFSSHDKLFVANNNKIALCDLATGKTKIIKAHQDKICSIACNAYGKYILTGSQDKTVKLWDVQNLLNDLNPTSIATFRHAQPVKSALFSPNEKFIATQDGLGKITMWDSMIEEELPPLEDDQEFPPLEDGELLHQQEIQHEQSRLPSPEDHTLLLEPEVQPIKQKETYQWQKIACGVAIGAIATVASWFWWNKK